jgi:hypothetical protein
MHTNAVADDEAILDLNPQSGGDVTRFPIFVLEVTFDQKGKQIKYKEHRKAVCG